MTVRSLLASIALVLPACAATGSELRSPATASAPVPQIDPTSQAQAFPSLRGDADLRSADTIAMHMQKVLGDSATAEVRVCVEPSGKVASVKLLKSSGMSAYDAAVLSDVAAWDFAAPSGKTACEDATIVYTLH
jgi:TonB family protein